jgi:hypothetical protein
MITRGDIVLLDTNVIIEAHRVRGWKVLARAAGISPQFKNHFTEKGLSALRADILMGGVQ